MIHLSPPFRASMEGPLNALLPRGCSHWSTPSQNLNRDFSAISTRSSRPTFRNPQISSAQKNTELDDPSNRDWKQEFAGIGEKSPLSAKKKKPIEKSRLLADTESMDWCLNARKSAIRSIESRGLAQSMESIVLGKKKKKSKKPKNPSRDSIGKKTRIEDELDDEFEDLGQRVSMIADGLFDEMRLKSRESFIQQLSQFSGPTNRKREISLNKQMIDAQTAEEVLDLASEAISEVSKGLSPSPLTPINISTTLHRIAKNMEKTSMPRSKRLSFARQREMCMLVGIAMINLPECSAQGISNISWALSKIGGELLYSSEMDRIGEIARTRIEEFNAQNIANVSGSFAAMQHSSPELFSLLSSRAADIVFEFHEQELAQALWAFASLNEPADSFLDALDRALNHGMALEFSEEYIDLSPEREKTLNFSRTQLGNLLWSYAALAQMDRPFFARLWIILSSITETKISEQIRDDVVFASQVYTVNQCLKVVNPHLDLSLPTEFEEKIFKLGKTRRFNQTTTSSFQKEVGRLLIGTGLEWVKEYAVDGFTLDAALVKDRLALEIDGPTHFSRNTGAPMGHTVLKRRYIEAAGWRLVSLSCMEWESLQGASEQLEYLRKILGLNESHDAMVD